MSKKRNLRKVNEGTLVKKNDTDSNRIKELLHYEELNILVDKIISYADNHFTKFSALFLVALTIGIWIIRIIGYCYQLGAFSLYNINKVYIEIIDTSLLYQTIQVIVISILIFISNFIYIIITTHPYQSKFQRNYKTILFALSEMILMFIVAMIYGNTSFKSLIDEIKNTNLFADIIFFALLFFLLFFIFVSINIFGIQIGCNKRKTNREALGREKIEWNNFDIILISIMTILCVGVLMLTAYTLGANSEKNRTSYKVIMEQINSTDIENNEYIFNTNDKVFKGSSIPSTISASISCKLYAIIFENEDVYVLNIVYKDNNTLFLDKNFQKIIDKQDVITYSIDAINKRNIIY